MTENRKTNTRLEAIELQELILTIVKAIQPISAEGIIAEVRKNYDEQPDEIRAAIFPLASIGEIVFHKQKRGMFILPDDEGKI